MKFRYEAYTKLGERVRDTVDAASEAEARAELSGEGLVVTEIEADGAKASKAAGGRVSYARIVEFSRELSVLVSTGTPLVDALESLCRQASDERWRAVLEQVTERVKEGNPLSEAMMHQPKAFDAVCTSLVAAGESSGRLDEMLIRLADLTRKQMKVKSAIRGAMVYPVLLSFVSLGVLALMAIFVLPRFRGLFEELDAPLPFTTELLLDMSGLLGRFWWLALGVLIGGGTGFVCWARTAAGRQASERVMLRAPKIGRIVRSLSVARLMRMMGVLLDSRVPMTEAIDLTSAAMPFRSYRDLLAGVRESVVRGEAMAAKLEDSALIPGAVAEAVRNGESSGKLSVVLTSLADYLDEENETSIKTISSLIEPVILVVLGVLVAFVAISLFLPLFDLTAAAGGTP